MRRVLLSLLLLSFSLALSAGVDHVGKVMLDGSLALPYTDNAWDFNTGRLTYEGTLDAYSERFSFHLDSSIVLDGVSDNSKDNSYAFDGLRRLYLRIKEAYADYYRGDFVLRAGRQIVTWGAADAITVTDVLCPQDKTSITSYDMTESKLGIDALKLSYSMESTIVDVYWIPFFTRTALPLEDGNPLKEVIVPKGSIQLGESVTATVNEFDSDDIESPGPALENGEYGIRMSRYLSFADFSLYGFYGFDNTPMIAYSLTGASPSYTLDLDGEYRHMAMVGADTSIPIGSKTLRVEGAYFPMRPFQTGAGYQISGAASRCEEHQMAAGLVGLDWMPSDWTITAQYYADWVFGDVSSIERDNFSNRCTLSLSRSFNGDEVEVGLSVILGLDDFDSVLNPSVKYRVSDEIVVSFSAMLMNPGPHEDGEYGAYRDLSSLVFRGTYSF